MAPKDAEYTLKAGAASHTCWDAEDWDGQMQDGCAGCAEAAQHPCRYCGYGHVFTTHNDVAHGENGDPFVPDEPSNEWHNSPHLYVDGATDTPREIDPRALTMPERRDRVIAAAAALMGPVPFQRSAGTDEAVVSATAMARLRSALDALSGPTGGLTCPSCGKPPTRYFEANVEGRRVVRIESDGHVIVSSERSGTDDYVDPEWTCDDGHSWPTGDEEVTFGE